MKKKIYLVFMLIFAVMLKSGAAGSDKDATDDKKAVPYIEAENESEINSKNDESDTLPQFSSYCNKTNLETGLKFKLNDYFEITPMLGLSDLIFSSDNNGLFHYNEAGLYTGAYFIFMPHEIFTINTLIANVEKFEPDSVIWSGLKIGLGFCFEINRANLDIEIIEEFNPMFQSGNNPKLTAGLSNTLEYSFVFNVFNFINEKTNTGFYIEGKLETCSLFNNYGFYSSKISNNEFYAGISTNPIEYFEAHFAYAMFNQALFDNFGSIEKGTNKFDLGFKAGLSFSYNFFSMCFDYVPHIFTSIDNVRDKFNQYFYLTITISLEKD